MFIDARATDQKKIESDICIVGAGAAGITLALALSGKNLRIILLESGGFEPEPDTQAALYRGEYRRAVLPAGEHAAALFWRHHRALGRCLLAVAGARIRTAGLGPSQRLAHYTRGLEPLLRESAGDL